jgi:Resolvase, N terminal domain
MPVRVLGYISTECENNADFQMSMIRRYCAWRDFNISYILINTKSSWADKEERDDFTTLYDLVVKEKINTIILTTLSVISGDKNTVIEVVKELDKLGKAVYILNCDTEANYIIDKVERFL